MASVLIDTNILVYAHDRSAGAKQLQAIHILEQLQVNNRGCLSTQVLGEFFRATTKGSTPLLTARQALRQMDYLARAWDVLNVTSPIVLEAARGVVAHQLSYWDAQVWATARLNQVPVILSEDFTPGTTLEAVRFVNPFAPDFVENDW
jgi:predicted nucleic acid-binding protein